MSIKPKKIVLIGKLYTYTIHSKYYVIQKNQVNFDYIDIEKRKENKTKIKTKTICSINLLIYTSKNKLQGGKTIKKHYTVNYEDAKPNTKNITTKYLYKNSA